MKVLLKIFSIFVLAAAIVLGTTACGDPGGSSENGGGGDIFTDYGQLYNDPEEWTVISNPLINNATINTWVWEIAAGKGHFVAVGGSTFNGGLVTTDSNWLVKRSRDGMNWQNVKGNFDRELRVVEYGSGTFMAADVGDYILGISTPPEQNEMRSRIFYSRDDGANWTGPISTNLWCVLGLVHGETDSEYGTWLALAQYGRIAKSIDGGVTWTILDPIGLPRGDETAFVNNISDKELELAGIPMVNNPSMTATMVYPAIKAGTYVKETGTWYIAGDFGFFASSKDLVEWEVSRVRSNGDLLYSPLLTNPSSYFITRMIHVDGEIHAIGSTPNVYSVLSLSNNPNMNWFEGSSEVTGFFGSNDAGNIVFGNGTMVIVGSGGRAMFKSVTRDWTNGMWLSASPLRDGQTWVNGLTYAGGMWLAGLRGGQIAYSDIRWD